MQEAISVGCFWALVMQLMFRPESFINPIISQLRDWLIKADYTFLKIANKLISCPFCFSFHVGWFYVFGAFPVENSGTHDPFLQCCVSILTCQAAYQYLSQVDIFVPEERVSDDRTKKISERDFVESDDGSKG